MSEENKNNPNHQKQNQPSALPCTQPKTDKVNSTVQQEKFNKHIKNAILAWHECGIMEKTQILLTICGIVTILVFILVAVSQHSDTRDSIALADSSLVLSQKSLQLAQQNFQIENRPYIGISSIACDTFAVHKINTITVIYKNYGKVPAVKLSILMTSQVHLVPDYARFDYPDAEKNRKTIFVLPPGEWGSASIGLDPLRRTEYDSILTGRSFLYAYGIFTYTDVFGGKDTTTFCGIYNLHFKRFSTALLYNEMK
jgi:hypothetical protein